MSQNPSAQNQPQNPDPSQPNYPQGYGQQGYDSQNGLDQTSMYPSAQQAGYGNQDANSYAASQNQSAMSPAGGYGETGYNTGGQAAGAYGSAPYAESPYAAGAPAAGGNQTGGQEKVGFFKALFDLKFEHFITIKFAAVIYVIAIVVSILTWIGNTIALFVIGGAASAASSYYGSGPSGEGMILGLLSLFLGWIPAVIQILVTRIVLEFVVSSIRTAQNTTALVYKD